MHNRQFALIQSIADQRSLLQESYQISKRWFDAFILATQQVLLHNSQALDAKYIDPDFTMKILDVVGKPSP